MKGVSQKFVQRPVNFISIIIPLGHIQR